jgi:hypothetical protein
MRLPRAILSQALLFIAACADMHEGKATFDTEDIPEFPFEPAPDAGLSLDSGSTRDAGTTFLTPPRTAIVLTDAGIPIESSPRDVQRLPGPRSLCNRPTESGGSTALLGAGGSEWIHVGQGAYALTTNARDEIFLGDTTVQKLTRDGEPIWCAGDFGRVFVLAARENGGVVAAGERVAPGCTFATKDCIRGFVTELDAAGATLWTLSFEDPGSSSRATGLALADGQIYVGGHFNGTLSVGGKRMASSAGNFDHFVMALAEGGKEALWLQTIGSPAEDADGVVLRAHPEAGVIAAGHLALSSGFVNAYHADGTKRFAQVVRGQVSLFQLVVDGRGSIWTAGVSRGTVEIGNDQPRELVTKGEFAAFVLALDAGGKPGALVQFTSARGGGVRSLGLAALGDGVFFIRDEGYVSAVDETRLVQTHFATIDSTGRRRELDSYLLLTMPSRHAAVTTTDGALLWTSSYVLPSAFGTNQSAFPVGRFLMRRMFGTLPAVLD